MTKATSTYSQRCIPGTRGGRKLRSTDWSGLSSQGVSGAIYEALNRCGGAWVSRPVCPGQGRYAPASAALKGLKRVRRASDGARVKSSPAAGSRRPRMKPQSLLREPALVERVKAVAALA